MQGPVLPGELPKALLIKLFSTIARRPITSYIVGEASRLSSCSLADPRRDYHCMETNNWEKSARRSRVMADIACTFQRECYWAYLER